MANYKLIITKVLQREGFILGKSIGYNNDKDDYGLETIGGISRKFWPNWLGWTIIDDAKQNPNFPKSLVSNQPLYDLIINFYELNFWDKIGGDGIKNDTIAEMLMKAAVNEGISPAIKRAESIVHIPETGHESDLLKTKLNILP